MADQVRPREDYNYTAKLPSFFEVFGAITGFLYISAKFTFKGYADKRLFLLQSLGAAGAGYLGGKLIYETYSGYTKRQMAWAEEYQKAHPQEFIAPAPKKYKDVLIPWRPIR